MEQVKKLKVCNLFLVGNMISLEKKNSLVLYQGGLKFFLNLLDYAFYFPVNVCVVRLRKIITGKASKLSCFLLIRDEER